MEDSIALGCAERSIEIFMDNIKRLIEQQKGWERDDNGGDEVHFVVKAGEIARSTKFRDQHLQSILVPFLLRLLFHREGSSAVTSQFFSSVGISITGGKARFSGGAGVVVRIDSMKSMAWLSGRVQCPLLAELLGVYIESRMAVTKQEDLGQRKRRRLAGDVEADAYVDLAVFKQKTIGSKTQPPALRDYIGLCHAELDRMQQLNAELMEQNAAGVTDETEAIIRDHIEQVTKLKSEVYRLQNVVKGLRISKAKTGSTYNTQRRQFGKDSSRRSDENNFKDLREQIESKFVNADQRMEVTQELAALYCVVDDDQPAKAAVGEEVAKMMKHLRTVNNEPARKLYNELLFITAPSQSALKKQVAKLLGHKSHRSMRNRKASQEKMIFLEKYGDTACAANGNMTNLSISLFLQRGR